MNGTVPVALAELQKEGPGRASFGPRNDAVQTCWLTLRIRNQGCPPSLEDRTETSDPAQSELALILEILTTCYPGSTAKNNECNLLATGLLCDGLVHDNHSAEKTMVLVQSPLRREVFSNEYVWVAVFVRTLYGKQSGL